LKPPFKTLLPRDLLEEVQKVFKPAVKPT